MHGPIVHYKAYQCWGVEEKNLRDVEYLKSFLYKIAQYCKTKPVDFFCHKFETGGEGITACLIVEESFIMVETWPEYQHFYVIARVCGPHIKINGVDNAIKEYFPGVKEMRPYREEEVQETKVQTIHDSKDLKNI